MEKNVYLLKKKIAFFAINVLVVMSLILHFFNIKLNPLFVEYGVHKSIDVSTKIINKIVSEQVKGNVCDEIVYVNEDDPAILNFNTAVLNSIGANTLKMAQIYFDRIEKGKIDEELFDVLSLDDVSEDKGITYKVPLARVFNNLFMSNIGLEIPVRYRFVNSLSGRIISTIKEYGINNALLEISLLIDSKIMVSVPFLSQQKSVEFSIPIIMKVIQGKVPQAFLGSSILGEV